LLREAAGASVRTPRSRALLDGGGKLIVAHSRAAIHGSCARVYRERFGCAVILVYLGERERRLWPEGARERATALKWHCFEAQPRSVHLIGRRGGREPGRPVDPGDARVKLERMLHRIIVPGDHLKILRGLYAHHAIYIGYNCVIHYWGRKEDKSSSCVQISTLAEFVGNSGLRALELVEYATCFPAEVVVARAREQVGATGWHALSNNCEHFARWCKTGEQRSLQADAVVGLGGGVTSSGVATATAVGVVSGVGAAAGLSGPGVLSGLATVGGAVGGGAVAGVAVLAAGPAVVATVAARHAFRDDARLPAHERSARALARGASAVGAAAGTLGSIAAISAAGAVPGLSGAGIASGLAAIGGTMVGGVAVAVAAPAVVAALFGYAVYRAARHSPGHR
jgi:hypothetical protein